MIRSTVITDASYCHKTKAGGWAAWINVNYENGEHRRIQESGIFRFRARSSEHAEQMACMNGIFLAYQAGARRILVQTDCLSLVQSEGRGTGIKNPRDYTKAQSDHWPDAVLEWRHVKGHTAGEDRRSWVNNWCDREAKKHMRKQRGPIRV